MSNVVIARSKPFPGWERFRRNLAGIGPFRALVHVQERAHNELRKTGAFSGDESHTPINHAILTRILLRLLSDDPTTITRQVEALNGAECTQIVVALEQLTGLVNDESNTDRAEELQRGSIELTRQIARWNWRTHLGTAGRSRVARCEIARTWLLLRKYWPRTRDRAPGKVIRNLVDPLVSAFNSFEYLFGFYLSLFNTDCGLVVEPREYLKRTELAEVLSNAFDLYVPEATTVVGNWAEIETQAPFPHRNPFRRDAIVRIGEQVLVAPDPGVLFSGVESRMINRAVRSIHAVRQIPEDSLMEGANTLLGYIYEDYLRELVAEAAKATGEKYYPEFTVDRGELSPDAMLRKGKNVILFECKARGLPVVEEQPASLDSLLQILRVLAGERDKRVPFAQLSKFFKRWRDHDPETILRLGRFSAGPRRCIIVCPDNLPNVVFWRLFRDQIISDGLNKQEQEAERMVEFASIYDIEILCAVAQLLNGQRRTVTVFELIERWRRSIKKTKGFDLDGSAYRVKWSLGDYLLTKHSDVNSLDNSRTKHALQAAFGAATAKTFSP